MRVKEPIFDYISPDTDYAIKNGDCLTVLKKIEDGNVLRHGRNNPPVPLLILGIEH